MSANGSSRRAVLIVNPLSDNGATGRHWPRIAAAVRGQGLEVVELLTEAAGHATVLAREAITAGETLIVAVGGDGTVNEVVNGFADLAGEPLETEASLGVVMRGTGCDFIRTYGIPRKERGAVAVLAGKGRRRIDLGRARFRVEAADGVVGEGVRLFANVGSCGLTGDVAARANRTSKRLGGTASFLYATVTAFGAWQNVPFTVMIDGEERRLVANNVIAANGRAFGGGIRIAPDAKPDDGLLEVVVIGDVGKLDLIRNVGRMYRGTLSKHPKVDVVRGRRVSVDTERPLPVELDGELPGTTPITFEVLPLALSLVVP